MEDNTESKVQTVMVERAGLSREIFDKVLSKKEWEAMIQMIYKRRDRKVKPVNVGLPGGINPRGIMSGDIMQEGEIKSGTIVL